MSRDPCHGCGERVRIAGGIAAIWSDIPDHTGGMTLECSDGTEAFLCFSCLERLPADPTETDIERLATKSD